MAQVGYLALGSVRHNKALIMSDNACENETSRAIVSGHELPIKVEPSISTHVQCDLTAATVSGAHIKIGTRERESGETFGHVDQ